MERNLTAVITMAGLGLRFRRAGYDCPKYMIEVKGKTLFEWSMDSLKGYREHISRYIFLALAQDGAADFILQKCRQWGIFDPILVELSEPTDGQATTCMRAMPYCSPRDALLVYNINTYVEPDQMRYEEIAGDGHIPCFFGTGDHWSFVKLNEAGKAVEVREKSRISKYCSLGAYYFSSAELYQRLYREYYGQGTPGELQEKYIAPLYNLMIEKGMEVTVSTIDPGKVHVLGTPKELKVFAL